MNVKITRLDNGAVMEYNSVAMVEAIEEFAIYLVIFKPDQQVREIPWDNVAKIEIEP